MLQIANVCAVLIFYAFLTIHAYAQDVSPLDGLRVAEYEAILDILKEDNRVTDKTQFVSVSLHEPDKGDVLSWRPGDPLTRKGFVVLRHDRQLYEAVVNVNDRSIESWQLQEGAQPILLDSEWALSQVILRTNEKWKQALTRRGIDNVQKVFCFPVFPGYFDLPRDQDQRRLGMISCYDTDSENAIWGRPIEGLLAVVDYDERSLVDLMDREVVPVPEGGPAIPAQQPTTIPARGPSPSRLQIDGSWVKWDKWTFHLRVDPREGPVLSQVSIRHGEQDRPVMYQGTLSEMFVPYMDPTQTWYHRAYLDIGEYGIGVSGVGLRLGQDCPADGHLMNANFMNERGKVYNKEGLVCLFERETGDTAWTHYEAGQGGTQARRGTELVVRFIVWLGNYDYVLDWIFTEDGTLRGRVGASGVVQVKGVKTQHMSEPTSVEDTAYGRLIAPGIVAINHDHFFAFRLDLDIDGRNNNLIIDRLQKVNVDEDADTPRRQIWQIVPDSAKRESQAKLNIDLKKPTLWRVSNNAVTNAQGNPVSYQLKPGVTARPLLDDTSFVQRRAGFAKYHLWATPYAREEKYAAGKYPNRHPGDAGLPTWTKSDRSVDNTDLVLWYTIGMHHVVRTEDWPIMPQVQHQFELRPFDFFDYNPAMGTP